MRNEFIKSYLGSCGKGVRLHGRIEITNPAGLKLGSNVHINRNALIRAEGGVIIDDNCHIARNLIIYSMNHNYHGRALPYDEDLISRPVSIGRNVWIGINVTIAPGTTIGDGAIIAMGAIVSGTVSPATIVASPKATMIGKRDIDHYQKLDAAGCYGEIAGYSKE